MDEDINPCVSAPQSASLRSSLPTNGKISFSRSPNTHFGSETNHNPPVGANAWYMQTDETLPSGAHVMIYSNYAGQTLFSSTLADGVEYLNYNRYDTSNRPILLANPSAVSNYDDSSLLNVAYLSQNSGKVQVLKYFDSGDGKGYLSEIDLRHGEAAADIKQQSFTYTAHTSNGVTIVLPQNVTDYPRDDGTNSQTTQRQYISWSDLQPTKVKVTPPGVASSQNGSGAANATDILYDVYGRQTSVTDGDGAVTTTPQYDNDTGAVKKVIADDGGLNLTTTTNTFDGLGRPLSVTDPNGNVVDYTYIDKQTVQAVIATPKNDFLGSATWIDWSEGLSYDLTFNKTGNVVESLTRNTLDHGGRVVTSSRFYDVSGITFDPAAGVIVAGGQRYDTQFTYDAGGRQNQTTDALGTVTTTDYDQLGRVKDVKIGDTVVQDNQYDNGEPSSYGGDSNLTKVTLHTGVSQSIAPDRITRYSYDWRDRLFAADNGKQLIYDTLNNQGQVKRRDVYDSTMAEFSGSFANGVPNETQDVQNASALAARTDTLYDNRGQVYQTIQYGNASTAALDQTLVTNIFHDGRGNVIATSAPGGLWTKTVYDGAGRLKNVYQTDNAGGSPFSISGDTIVSETNYGYDGNGNTILITS